VDFTEELDEIEYIYIPNHLYTYSIDKFLQRPGTNIVRWLRSDKDFRIHDRGWRGIVKRQIKLAVDIRGHFESGNLRIIISRSMDHPTSSISRRYKYRRNIRSPAKGISKYQIIVTFSNNGTTVFPLSMAATINAVITEGVWKYVQNLKIQELEDIDWG